MKTGIIVGSFDLLHVGHIYLFKQAKSKCDFLIVGLHVDPSIERPEKNRPIESLIERQIKLKTNKYVDAVVVYEREGDLSIIFDYFKPDVRFLGSDYKDGDKKISYPDMIPTEFLDSLPIHTSGIRERVKEA